MILLLLNSFALILSASGYDPELHMTVPELIRSYEYPCEIHNVTTSDGYILELHRIPKGRDPRPVPYINGSARPVVVFMHGLLSDSSNFALNPPTTGAAYIFADAGFDVWLLNCRGTPTSQRHKTLSTSQKEYWNFTWYDHARYDLSDSIDYILHVTEEENVYYIAHSQGTIIGFARLSDDPDKSFAKKIRQVYALGPVGGLSKKIYTIFHIILDSPLYQIMNSVFDFIGDIPFQLPKILQNLLSDFCQFPLIGQISCFSLVDLLGVEKNGQINASRIPLYVKHFPTTTSILNMIHWAQVIHYHGIRKLDLGQKKNVEVYGQLEPPELNISTIATPTYLYFSDDDIVTPAMDALEFIVNKYGPGLRGHYLLDHFTHVDFAVGLRAPEEVYRPIIRNIYEDLKERSCL